MEGEEGGVGLEAEGGGVRRGGGWVIGLGGLGLEWEKRAGVNWDC